MAHWRDITSKFFELVLMTCLNARRSSPYDHRYCPRRRRYRPYSGGIDGVSEAFSVTGDHDVIAIVRVNEHEDLADVIPEHIGKVPGVTGITTYLAFQTFSQEMLDEAFHIGLD